MRAFFIIIVILALATPANAKKVNLQVHGEAACDALPHPGYAPVAYVEVIASTPIPASDQFAGYRIMTVNEQNEVREYFSHTSFDDREVLTLCKRGKNLKLANLVW